MAIVMMLAVCGCGEDGDALERILRKEKIVFGIAPDSLPVSGESDEDGPVGISVEIGNQIAARLGVEAEYIFISQENAVQYINDGIIDCYLNLAEPDLRTATQIRMVDSLFDWRQVAVVPQWSRAKQLVNLTGGRVCVVSQSDASAALDEAEMFRSSLTGVVYTDDYMQIMRELTGSTCDAAIVDELEFLNSAGTAKEKFAIIDEPIASRNYVLAFAYEDQHLAERVQSIYDDMNADGTIQNIRNQWI